MLETGTFILFGILIFFCLAILFWLSRLVRARLALPSTTQNVENYETQSPEEVRNILFKNSLISLGEIEWMCAICGFDNSPRKESCTMCGTLRIVTRTINERKKSNRENSLNPSKDRKSILQQISLQDSENTRGSIRLTSVQLSEAINYRRLNKLSLRQKIASRRKQWRRVFDENLKKVIWARRDGIDDPNNNTRRTRGNSALPSPILSGNTIIATNNNQSSSSSRDARRSSARKNSSNSFRNSSFRLPGSLNAGFSSVMDEEGNLSWEQVMPDTSASVPKSNLRTFAELTLPPRGLNPPQTPPSLLPSSQHHQSDLENPPLNAVRAVDPLPHNRLPSFAGRQNISSQEKEEDEDDNNNDEDDLEEIASWSFKDKQAWFLDRMDEYRIPYSEGFVRITVRRTHLLQDSANSFGKAPANELHKTMRYIFHNEPGVDAGGVMREWFELNIKSLLDPRYGLFTSSYVDSIGGCYHINPTSGHFVKEHLKYFRFAGRLFGKAIMDQVMLGACLSLPLRKQMLSIPITFSDLEYVDSDLYRNLISLTSVEDVESLCLFFSVCYEHQGHVSPEYELKPGGRDIPVTNQNINEYLMLRLRHRLLDSIRPQLQELLTGLFEFLPAHLLSVFDYQELELLMCGMPSIDMDDWRRHTVYAGNLSPSSPQIQWFWEIVEGMDEEERIRLLQFVTGASRVPAQGFKMLQSYDGNFRPFTITSIQKSVSLYPRAHTCFNRLDLPIYDSRDEMESFLSVVVNMDITGFQMD